MPNPSSINPGDLERLLRMARDARNRAYAPYSRFKVGAALLTWDGQITTGCNVEIPTWEEACCAERTAIANAITRGYANPRTDFIRLLAVSTQASVPGVALSNISPCGACRQVIADFSPHCTLVLDDGESGHVTDMATLLPHNFSFTHPADYPAPVNCELLEQQAAHNPHAGNLLEVARAMRNNADRHVQNLPEGAVIITTDDKAYCGASVENGCTPLTIRALRAAVLRAIADGAAHNGPAFIRQAALVVPGRGRDATTSLRQAINPALVAEFFTDDADITLQVDDAPALSLRAADLFGWSKGAV